MDNKKYIQVECAVLWPDYTWSDCNFAYVPEETPESVLKREAVEQIERGMQTARTPCFMVVVCNINHEERFTFDDDPIDD
jgi:hypothetical protein